MQFNLIPLSLAALLAGAQASAQPTREVPRGPDIGTSAANCGLGTEQTGKAGQYNGLCSQLTEAEKCLAFIKGSISREGEMHRSHDPVAVGYCLATFRAELLGD